MASGRMLQRKISSNKQLPKLMALLDERMGAPHGAMAMLLYTWSIAHLDAEGRMHGDIDLVKGQVVPRISFITPDLIETYLLAMQEVGLVVYYEAEDDRWLAFPGFDRNQPHLRKEREAKSSVPDPEGSKQLLRSVELPTPAEVRSDTGLTPAEVKLSKENELIHKRTYTRVEREERIQKLFFVAAWRNAGLGPIQDPSSMEELRRVFNGDDCDADPVAYCEAWKKISSAWRKKMPTSGEGPALMLKHLDKVQLVVSGEMDPDSVPKDSGKKPEPYRPRLQTVEELRAKRAAQAAE